jgi:hypothetical protein
MPRRVLGSLLSPTLTALIGMALPAGAFTIDEGFVYCEPSGFCSGSSGEVVDVSRTLAYAPRWDADPASASSLADGIQVSVDPNFGAALAAITPLSAADYETALVEAFRAWETPELSFDIRFDASPGLEIDVFAVDSSHWLFSPGNFISGYALFWTNYVPSRRLTNGQIQPGWAMTSAEIYIAVDRVKEVFSVLVGLGVVQEGDRFVRFQNFMSHEIGHTLGLDHPEEFYYANFDTDLDPLNEMPIDPLDPTSGMMQSPNFDHDAIMTAVKGSPAGYVFTELTHDDRGGLNVLYPTAWGTTTTTTSTTSTTLPTTTTTTTTSTTLPTTTTTTTTTTLATTTTTTTLPRGWRIALCHLRRGGSQNTILVTSRRIQRHLAHGDFTGECPGSTKALLCHMNATGKPRTLLLPARKAQRHLDHGDATGECALPAAPG